MKVFLDTNVLVATCLEDHAQHEPALAVLERILGGKDKGVTSAHALAEAYAVMTRLPKPMRVAPSVATSLLEENVVKHFELIALTGREYATLVIEAGKRGLVGGLLYDALHVACAEKAKVDRMYSWNVGHLQSIASEEFRSRIVTP
jgi:predicted nucleic acid-binding protein